MSLFGGPPKPPRPPTPATKADASVQLAGQEANTGFDSLITTSPTGLKKPAQGQKRTLIGGY
jgi:hypothetical protein